MTDEEMAQAWAKHYPNHRSEKVSEHVCRLPSHWRNLGRRYCHQTWSSFSQHANPKKRVRRRDEQALKLKLEEIETQPDAKDLVSAFQRAKQNQVNAIMMIPTRPFFAERKRIVELASKHQLPASRVDLFQMI